MTQRLTGHFGTSTKTLIILEILLQSPKVKLSSPGLYNVVERRPFVYDEPGAKHQHYRVIGKR